MPYMPHALPIHAMHAAAIAISVTQMHIIYILFAGLVWNA